MIGDMLLCALSEPVLPIVATWLCVGSVISVVTDGLPAFELPVKTMLGFVVGLVVFAVLTALVVALDAAPDVPVNAAISTLCK